MRTRMAALVFALGLAWAAPAGAQGVRVELEEDREALLELGVSAGWPTGFSGKYWMSNRNAVQAGIAWNPAADGLTLTGDYLLHTRSQEIADDVELPVYVGLGARVTEYTQGEDEIVIGPRVPIGVEALFEDLPFSVFAEIAPTLEYGRADGDADLVADGAVGARLLF